jgi:hypothetical protein
MPHLVGRRVKAMKYNFVYDAQLEARIFHFILRDYLISKERHLVSALEHLEQEVPRWLNRVGGMAGEW